MRHESEILFPRRLEHIRFFNCHTIAGGIRTWRCSRSIRITITTIGKIFKKKKSTQFQFEQIHKHMKLRWQRKVELEEWNLWEKKKTKLPNYPLLNDSCSFVCSNWPNLGQHWTYLYRSWVERSVHWAI